MPPVLRYSINLLDDQTVVTQEGEVLGTWDTDESDAIYEFTPDGATEPLLLDTNMPGLCARIDEWLKAKG